MQLCDKAMDWEGREIQRDIQRETGMDKRGKERYRSIDSEQTIEGFSWS